MTDDRRYKNKKLASSGSKSYQVQCTFIREPIIVAVNESSGNAKKQLYVFVTR